MEYSISTEQQLSFEKKGYLILRDILSPSETIDLKQWAQEVHDLPQTSETPWMPYEEVNSAGKRILCRTENYANYHMHFNDLLRGNKIMGILGQLAKEEMVLFKEKSTCTYLDCVQAARLTAVHSQLQTCRFRWLLSSYRQYSLHTCEKHKTSHDPPRSRSIQHVKRRTRGS